MSLAFDMILLPEEQMPLSLFSLLLLCPEEDFGHTTFKLITL